MPARKLALVALASALVPLASVRGAVAQETSPSATASCIAEHEAAQLEAKEGRLLSARAKAEACGKDVCPTLVRGFCLKLVEEYTQKTPSLVVAARGADGCDTTSAKVTLDGEPWLDKLDGRAVSLDPGEHRVRIEIEGVASEEQLIVAAEGEQGRVITFGQARAAQCGKGEAPSPPMPPPDPGPSGLTLAGMVVGGFSLASLATAGGLGIAGLVMRSDLEDCKPCSEEQVDDVRTKFVIGDIFLATGVVALGVSIGLLVAGGSSSDEAPVAFVLPALDGQGAHAGFKARW